MDPTIAKLLADAATQGGNIFVINCNYGPGSDGSEMDEANEMEPVEGPGPDGSAAHEGAEGEAPEPAEMAAPSPAKKPKKQMGFRTEK